ncbi:MAG: hypothetical protein HZA77_02265 [Candidatus Schekmanbacteria bacterium]|nr:hypothetical protein [Candidatus Schekmanbacteria bacterium]
MVREIIENEIIQLALDALKKHLKIEAKIEIIGANDKPQRDCILKMLVQGKEICFCVEVKANVTRTGLRLIQFDNVKNLNPMIVITKYVNRQMADEFKQNGIEFIDTAGNAYINQPPLYIFIKGNKPPETFTRTPLRRTFQPTGLKLIYAFLCNRGLENKSYREIAATAGVALGTVVWLMKELKELGYLLDMGKRGNKIIQREKLFQRWVTAYPEKLRPKQILGHFKGEQDWWQQKELNPLDAQWGGEVAAAKLTQYLKPQLITIYTTTLQINQLLMENRLRKDPEGEVEILERFWIREQEGTHEDTVHPILIYADLIATDNERNIETAKVIYEQYIVRLIRED